ncbi:MAG TPA: TetR/AcrR family transcriptional regulator [Pseudomonadales bacterium]|nr:TetR/AcrR family transcriptional regulator [Pseudomonadales bacterium]
MTVPFRQYQGESAEARVETRRRQLLDTAYDAIASEEWKGMSIGRLCQLAGLNKRYFYESFTDLEELPAVLIEELSSDLINRSFNTVLRVTAQGLSTALVARHVLQTLVEFFTDDPRRTKILFSDVVYSASIKLKRKDAIANLATALSAYGHYHYEGGKRTDPIASLTSAMLIGGTIEAIESWLNGGIAMTREQLIDDLAALWLANGDVAAERAKSRATATKQKR